MAITYSTSLNILPRILGTGTWVPPTTVYYALFTASPIFGSGQIGTEVSGGGYARVAKACNMTNFSGTQGKGTTAISNGVSGDIYNNNDVTFPMPSAGWGTIVAVGLFDALTAGNLLVYGPYLPSPFTVDSGSLFVLSSGQFSIALASTG